MRRPMLRSPVLLLSCPGSEVGHEVSFTGTAKIQIDGNITSGIINNVRTYFDRLSMPRRHHSCVSDTSGIINNVWSYFDRLPIPRHRITASRGASDMDTL